MNARASTRGAPGAHARSRCQQGVRPLLRSFLTSFLIFMQFPFLKKDAAVRTVRLVGLVRILRQILCTTQVQGKGCFPFLKLPEKLSHETVAGSTLKLNPLAVAQGRYSVYLLTTASPAPSASLISLSTTPFVFSPSLGNQKYSPVPYLC